MAATVDGILKIPAFFRQGLRDRFQAVITMATSPSGLG